MKCGLAGEPGEGGGSFVGVSVFRAEFFIV